MYGNEPIGWSHLSGKAWLRTITNYFTRMRNAQPRELDLVSKGTKPDQANWGAETQALFQVSHRLKKKNACSSVTGPPKVKPVAKNLLALLQVAFGSAA